MSRDEQPFDSIQRPTAIGPFSAAQPGTSRMRSIPAPWIDCAECGWRHYPSTSGGAWHIATACVSCGGPLPGVAASTDQRPEVANGIEAADDDGEART